MRYFVSVLVLLVGVSFFAPVHSHGVASGTAGTAPFKASRIIA